MDISTKDDILLFTKKLGNIFVLTPEQQRKLFDIAEKFFFPDRAICDLFVIVDQHLINDPSIRLNKETWVASKKLQSDIFSAGKEIASFQTRQEIARFQRYFEILKQQKVLSKYPEAKNFALLAPKLLSARLALSELHKALTEMLEQKTSWTVDSSANNRKKAGKHKSNQYLSIAQGLADLWRTNDKILSDKGLTLSAVPDGPFCRLLGKIIRDVVGDTEFAGEVRLAQKALLKTV